MLGKIKWYNEERGFGFLTSDEDGKDYFCHYTEIKDEQKILFKGDRVEFEPSENHKGLLAQNIITIKE